jgi:hypothetical protein
MITGQMSLLCSWLRKLGMSVRSGVCLTATA